jgi:hypothetical protein
MVVLPNPALVVPVAAATLTHFAPAVEVEPDELERIDVAAMALVPSILPLG